MWQKMQEKRAKKTNKRGGMKVSRGEEKIGCI